MQEIRYIHIHSMVIFTSQKRQSVRMIRQTSRYLYHSLSLLQWTRVELTLWNRTDRSEAVNFTYTYSKSNPYTERLNYIVQTNGEWQFVPVEATSVMNIRGISD